MRIRQTSVSIVLAAAVTGGVVFAQTRGGTTEWLTAGGDAQRTSWIRTDMNISLESMSKPGFELQWKSKLDNPPRESSNLHQGVTANGVTLFVPVAVVTGSSNNVYAIDSDTGYIIWQQHLAGALPAGTAACPGGITAAATRIVSVTLPPPSRARAAAAGGGRSRRLSRRARRAGRRRARAQCASGRRPADAAARTGGCTRRRGARSRCASGSASGRGRAAGAPDPAAGRGGRGAAGPAPSNAGIPGAPLGLAAAGNARVAGVTYVVGSDGMLHVMGLQTGKDMQKPAPFLPANAKFSDLIAVEHDALRSHEPELRRRAERDLGDRPRQRRDEGRSPRGRPTAAASSARRRSRRTACSSRRSDRDRRRATATPTPSSRSIRRPSS